MMSLCVDFMMDTCLLDSFTINVDAFPFFRIAIKIAISRRNQYGQRSLILNDDHIYEFSGIYFL